MCVHVTHIIHTPFWLRRLHQTVMQTDRAPAKLSCSHRLVWTQSGIRLSKVNLKWLSFLGVVQFWLCSCQMHSPFQVYWDTCTNSSCGLLDLSSLLLDGTMQFLSVAHDWVCGCYSIHWQCLSSSFAAIIHSQCTCQIVQPEIIHTTYPG